MALKETWRPRIDGVDDADSSAVNEIAADVIELEKNSMVMADKINDAAKTAKVGAEAAVALLDIGLTVVDGKLNITFEEDI